MPFSILTSWETTSAIRRSSSVLLARSTATFAASSHDFSLEPITSMTLYTLDMMYYGLIKSRSYGSNPRHQMLLHGIAK